MKLLTIDDSMTMRRIISCAAAVVGLEPIGAANGKAALQIMEQEGSEIALILLDWNMPGMDGIEVLRRLRANPRWAAIPIMMVTSDGERSRILEAVQAGANGYLTKPFATEDLVTRMLQCLGR